MPAQASNRRTKVSFLYLVHIKGNTSYHSSCNIPQQYTTVFLGNFFSKPRMIPASGNSALQFCDSYLSGRFGSPKICGVVVFFMCNILEKNAPRGSCDCKRL